MGNESIMLAAMETRGSRLKKLTATLALQG